MKKLVFFIPAIVFTFFYGFAALTALGAIHPSVAVLLLLLWIAGVLLSKSVCWGGLFGVAPAVLFIYMGTQETGQIINETPIGIVLLLYYAVCIYFVYRKNHAKRS